MQQDESLCNWGAVMRSLTFVLLGLVASTAAGQQSAPAPAPIVYFDIAGPQGGALQQFYADLFGWAASATGEVSVPVTSPLPGLFKDPQGNPMALIEMEDGKVIIP